MTVTKEFFAELITKAADESKKLLNRSRKNEREKRKNSYIEKIGLSKVERFYSLVYGLISDRITSITDKEVETYKKLRLASIVNSINMRMISLDNSSSDNMKIKEKIDELISAKKKLEKSTCDDIRKDFISMLNLPDQHLDDEELNMLNRVFKDEKTCDEFFDLFEKYRSIDAELKRIAIERTIIANDLMPLAVNYEFTKLSEDDFLTVAGLKKLQEEISKYVQKSTDEELNEKENFGEMAKQAFMSTIVFDEVKPIGKEELEFLKPRLVDHPRLYDKAKFEFEEWEMLSNKTFKTSKDDLRISELEREIINTKIEINSAIREWYKKYYSNNNLYKPLSTRRNNKFIYYIGYEYLNDFFEYGEWPDKEKLQLLSASRELNRVEAEMQILRIELAKVKHSEILTSSVKEKEKEKKKIADKMTKLIGDWKNPVIMQIIGRHLLDKNVRKEDDTEELLFEEELIK